MKHIPEDRERFGLLYPLVGAEQQMEQSLTLNAVVDLLRSNGQQCSFSNARIVEFYQGNLRQHAGVVLGLIVKWQRCVIYILLLT